tara:strand:- start:605 stop:1591 length:987 start_codon:yes stop_codon:yes gene_type:complete
MAQTTSEVWDSRWSSTRRTIDPKVIDNIFEPYNVINALRKRGMQMVDGGGKEIQVILESSAGTAEAFDKYDPLSKSPRDPFESAFYKRRYYAIPIVLSDTEDWENSGAEQIFSLLSALGDNAMNSLLKTINEDCVSAQSGKKMLGLQDLATIDGTGTVGGINASTSTWWKNQFLSADVTFTNSTGNIYDGIQAWNKIMDKVRKQGGRTDAIFTTYSIAGAYRTALSSQGYAELSGTKVNGLNGQEFPGFMGAEVIADGDIPATEGWFVDKRSHQLRVMKNANFKKTPFVSLQSNGQLGQLSYMVAGVQQITNNRRRLGRVDDIVGIDD